MKTMEHLNKNIVRRKPIRIFQDYEIDDKVNGTVTETIKKVSISKNSLIYEKHNLDIDYEEAKELARIEGKSSVIIVENSSLKHLKVFNKKEIDKIKLDLKNKMFECKTVKELIETYILLQSVPYLETLRLLDAPFYVLQHARKKIAGAERESDKFVNEQLIDTFIIKTGYKGCNFLYITLKDGTNIIEGQYGTFFKR